MIAQPPEQQAKMKYTKHLQFRHILDALIRYRNLSGFVAIENERYMVWTQHAETSENSESRNEINL